MISLLKVILEVSITAGAATVANRKLSSNGPTCDALGWECLLADWLLTIDGNGSCNDSLIPQ